jgi:hypothetical protein
METVQFFVEDASEFLTQEWQKAPERLVLAFCVLLVVLYVFSVNRHLYQIETQLTESQHMVN